MHVFHGPVEISGQVYNSAEAIRQTGHDAHAVVFEPHEYGYDYDEAIYPHGFPGKWRSRIRRTSFVPRALHRFDVFNYWFGRTILNELELRAASALGKPVVMTFCGSEIRSIPRAAEKNPYMDAESWPKSPVEEAYLERLNQHIDAAIAPYRELKPHVERHFDRVEFIPRAVDCRAIQPRDTGPSTETVQVAHAPSDRGVKGTEYVEGAVSRLESEGYDIELVVIEGRHDEVIVQLQQADIVVDQLRLGCFGVVALEAMAAGTPVICYLRDDLQAQYPESLPIVNATPDSISGVLGELVSDQGRRERLGQEGRRYVEMHHSLPVVGEQLVELYRSLGATTD